MHLYVKTPRSKHGRRKLTRRIALPMLIPFVRAKKQVNTENVLLFVRDMDIAPNVNNSIRIPLRSPNHLVMLRYLIRNHLRWQLFHLQYLLLALRYLNTVGRRNIKQNRRIYNLRTIMIVRTTPLAVGTCRTPNNRMITHVNIFPKTHARYRLIRTASQPTITRKKTLVILRIITIARKQKKLLPTVVVILPIDNWKVRVANPLTW